MSLLLDALRQAEESKKQSAQDLSIGEVESGSVQKETVNEHIEELNQGLEIEEDFTIDEESLRDDKLDTGELSLPEVSLPAKTSLEVDELSLAEDIEVKDSIIENKPESNSRATLDPTLNIFSTGEKKASKTDKTKFVLFLLALITIALIIAFWLFQGQDTISYEYDEPVLGEVVGTEDSLLSNTSMQLNNESGLDVTNKSASIIEKSKQGLVQFQSEAGSKVNTVVKKLSTTPTLSAEISNRSVRQERATVSKSTIKIKKRTLPLQLSDKLSRAYALLLSGDYRQSRVAYEQVLSERPKQIDALLGLAKINSHDGRLQEARQLYDKALIIDSSNTIAQLGLLHSYGRGSPQQKLAALRDLSNKFSQNAQILVSLGHELSSQSKWSEAQEAYFQAFSLKPLNAIYVYNLAVSLDRLEKYDTAKRFYRQAITLNEQKATQLNTVQVEERLLQLGDL